MHRINLHPRPNWQKRVEEHGLLFHTLKGEPYWDETAAYQLSSFEVDQLELAANTLHEMCLDLVQEVIDEKMFGLFLIPKEFEEMVIRSWEEQEPSIYGRFDLAYDGVGAPRLLEYNADTPTALLEASIVQWQWLKDIDERERVFELRAPGLAEAKAPTRTGDLSRRRLAVGAALVVVAVAAAMGTFLSRGGGGTANAATVAPNEVGVIDTRSGAVAAHAPRGPARARR